MLALALALRRCCAMRQRSSHLRSARACSRPKQRRPGAGGGVRCCSAQAIGRGGGLRVGACCTNSRLCSSPNLVWSALLLATGCNWLASSVMLVGHHQASESKKRLLCFPFLVRAEAAQGEALALAQAAESGVFLPNHFVEIRRSHLLVGVMCGGRLQATAWMGVGAHARRHIVCLGLAMQAQNGCLLEIRPLQHRPTKLCRCVLCTSSQVDGFQKLGGAAAASLLRGRVRITFVDDEGEREAGVVSELWL
jgi:hypothetical protein